MKTILIFLLLICFHVQSQQVEPSQLDESQFPSENVNSFPNEEGFFEPRTTPEPTQELETTIETPELEVQKPEIIIENPEPCNSIFNSEDSLETQLQNLATLEENSWICFNELYLQIFNESLEETSLQIQETKVFKTNKEELLDFPNSLHHERIIDLLEVTTLRNPYIPPYRYLTHLPLNTLWNPLGLSSLYSKNTLSLYQQTESIFASSFIPIRNHLLLTLLINDFYFNPTGYILTQEQLSLLRSYLHFDTKKLNLQETEMSAKNRIIHFPVFALCERQGTESSLFETFNSIQSSINQYISTNQETYTEYFNLVSLLNLTNIPDTLSVSIEQMYHFVPYGFDFSTYFMNLPEEEKQNFSPLITHLKKYTFIKTLLLKDLNCLKNLYQERVVLSVYGSADLLNHETLETNPFALPEENPILLRDPHTELNIHHTLHEFPQANLTFLGSSFKISHSTFRIPYQQENDLFEYTPSLKNVIKKFTPSSKQIP